VGAEEGAALEREQVREAEKRRIAEAAAELVEPGSTIFLSGGTTTERVVPYLARLPRLTVVTNALNVATALATTPEIEVIVLGGYLRHSEMTLLGPMVEQTIGTLRVGQALYGCFGLDAEEGLTGASLAEASTDRIVLDAVDRVTILADASKFAQRGPARLAEVSRIATLVTDRDAPADGVARLREQGVEVIRA
jgi:DeoR/GlpR family transcriptional regulator of sugar metabolism